MPRTLENNVSPSSAVYGMGGGDTEVLDRLTARFQSVAQLFVAAIGCFSFCDQPCILPGFQRCLFGCGVQNEYTKQMRAHTQNSGERSDNTAYQGRLLFRRAYLQCAHSVSDQFPAAARCASRSLTVC